MTHASDLTRKFTQFIALFTIFCLILRCCTVVGRRRLVQPAQLINALSSLVKGWRRRLLAFECAALHRLHSGSAAFLFLQCVDLIIRLDLKLFLAAVGLKVRWTASRRVKLHIHGVLVKLEEARVTDYGTWQCN